MVEIKNLKLLSLSLFCAIYGSFLAPLCQIIDKEEPQWWRKYVQQTVHSACATCFRTKPRSFPVKDFVKLDGFDSGFSQADTFTGQKKKLGSQSNLTETNLGQILTCLFYNE